jgi:hypothetical protein
VTPPETDTRQLAAATPAAPAPTPAAPVPESTADDKKGHGHKKDKWRDRNNGHAEDNEQDGSESCSQHPQIQQPQQPQPPQPPTIVPPTPPTPPAPAILSDDQDHGKGHWKDNDRDKWGDD